MSVAPSGALGILSPKVRRLVPKADRAGVIQGASRLSSKGPWLPNSHHYQAAPIRTLENEVNSGTPPRKGPLVTYMAATVPTHCADGWGYVGRALIAASMGDASTARHLAYYAELRAAMALLSSEGIAVLNRLVAVVAANGDVSAAGSGQGTHAAIWPLVDWWIDQPTTASRFGGLIEPEGLSIDQWISAMPRASTWRILGAEWLRTWGLDLKRLRDDRDDRNVASYQPSALPPAPAPTAQEVASYLRSLWEMFEPSATAFARFDLELLRASLHAGFRISGRSSAKEQRSDIAHALDGLMGQGQRRDFLQRLLETPPQGGLEDIIGLASKTDRPGTPTQHLQVISRAVILLRVATGYATSLYRDAGLDLRDFEFWWKGLGETRGFWPPAAPPPFLPDLWDDIELAILEVSSQVEDDPSSSYHTLTQGCQSAVTALGGCERIALWSMT